MAKKSDIIVKEVAVKTIKHGNVDYICMTDIARMKNAIDPNGVVANWMRNRNTIEFLGIWETLYNPNFNPLEFEGIRAEATWRISMPCYQRGHGAIRTPIQTQPNSYSTNVCVGECRKQKDTNQIILTP